MHARTASSLALAAILAALAAAPCPAAAQARRSGRAAPAAPVAPPDSLSVGGLVGYEWGSDIGGLQLRADGELPFQQLAPQLKLSFVGSVGFTHSTYSAFGYDTTVNRLKLVPAARFTMALTPELAVFGDAGIGLHYTRVSVDLGPFGTSHDSGIGVLLRFGAGGFYRVTPVLRLLAELVVDPTFGTYHETSAALLVGAMVSL